MAHPSTEPTGLAVRNAETDGDPIGVFPYGPLREEDARFCPYCYRDAPDRTCSTQAHWPTLRRRAPLYLSGVECAATRRMAAAGMAIGLMLQPSSALELAARSYGFWAADNGCFTRGDQFDPHRWFAWLAGLPDVGVRRRCLFAVAPDVLCDAEATWQRSWPWLELVRGLGVPVALVAQNGVEAHVATWDCDECWDVCFIGGDTDWKTSAEARDVAREAQLQGKWVHVGRVNSWKRIDRVADWDVDSVDGTFLRFGPDTHGARLTRWLQRLDTTPTLF